VNLERGRTNGKGGVLGLVGDDTFACPSNLTV
jgi:hypothetical protein